MSELTYRASDAATQSTAYVESLFAALGARDPIEVLSEMPSALRNAVARLTSKQEQTPEREGKWSVRHVVQHVADSELVGAFRYRMLLAHDAPALPGYDQDAWADRLRYAETDIPTALGDFAALRLMNLRLLRRATPVELRRVMRHSERGEESLQTMIRMYAGHDIVHLRQILRIRQAIGAAGQA